MAHVTDFVSWLGLKGEEVKRVASRTIEQAAALLTQRSLIVATGKYHGLGNRVRAVLGGEVLARQEKRVFAYTWPTGPTFGASINDLWEYDEFRMPTVLSRALSWHVPYRNGSLEWLNNTARREQVWQIKTAHALQLPDAAPWEVEFQALQPVIAVRRRVEEVFQAHFSERPFVGVMVRADANSHAETLRHSPVEWFIQRMTEIQKFWPEVDFFVSADSSAAVDQILHHFPNAVSQSDKGRFNSKKGLVASVADLYLLASSSHILGPHYSSFPELAQCLAGNPVLLETSRNASTLTSVVRATSVDDPLKPSRRRARF